MEVIIAKDSGFCFGVKRAIRMALSVAQEGEVYTLGPLIHNPPMVEEMKKKGVIPIKNLEKLKNERVIIPSHGTSLQILKKIQSKVKETIDTTCPFIKRMREEAIRLFHECQSLIIVGERDHPEIKGILSFLSGRKKNSIFVVKDRREIPDKFFPSCGIVAQTTMSELIFKQVVIKALSCCRKLKIINTICNATRKRQSSTLRLLRDVEVMIVIGGYNSANTRRLFELCKERSRKPVYHIEDEKELKDEWFGGYRRVGITGGASTPSWMIEKIAKKVSYL